MKDLTFERLIQLLELKPNRKGFFKTVWGKKTREGLKASIENIIKETEGKNG